MRSLADALAVQTLRTDPRNPSARARRGAASRGIEAAARALGKPASELPADATAIAAMQSAKVDRQAVWAARRAIEVVEAVPEPNLRTAVAVARKADPTLADVMDAVGVTDWDDKGRVIRSLQCVAAFLRLAPAEIPARFAELDEPALKKMTAGHFRVDSPATAKVMRSRARAAIRLLDCFNGRRPIGQLNGGWETLRFHLDAAIRGKIVNGSSRGELLPFFAFCSAKGFGPGQADKAVAAWAAQLEHEKKRGWKKKVRRLVHRWNALGESHLIASLPSVRLAAPTFPTHRVARSFKDLNPLLQLSWKDWEKRHTPPRSATSLLERIFPKSAAGRPPAAPSSTPQLEQLFARRPGPDARGRRDYLSATYLKGLEWHLCFVYTRLVEEGVPEAKLASVEAVLTYERFSMALEAMIRRKYAKSDREGQPPHLDASIERFASQLITIAKGAGVDQADLEEMDRVANALRRETASGGPRNGCQMSPRRRAMLQQFNAPERILAWYYRPARIYEQVMKALGAVANGRVQFALIDPENITKERCAAMESAVVMLIEQNMPLRCRNVGTTRWKGDRPNLSLPTRQGEDGFLRYDGAETKTKVNLSTPLDPDAVQLIRVWIEVFLPWKIAKQGVDPANVYLFPARGLEHKGLSNLTTNVRRQYAAVGLDLDLHIHRALAGKIILTVHPFSIELVARLLGHRDAEVTRKFYAEEVDPFIVHATWQRILKSEIERLSQKKLLTPVP